MNEYASFALLIFMISFGSRVVFSLCLIPFLSLIFFFQDFLGQTFCTLGEIVGSPASRLEKPLG